MSQTAPENILPQPLRATRQLCIGSYFALIGLYSLVRLSAEDINITIWAVQCLPLLIFAPGLLGNRHKSYNWLCFVVLAYFLFVVPNVMSGKSQWDDWVQLVLICIIFTAAMFTSRWLQAWQFYQTHKDNEEPQE